MTLRHLTGSVLIAAAATEARAATLPEHEPLRILIVSDEVNPHGLSDAELTQPGDLSAAILTPGSGLTLSTLPESLIEIPTNDIEMATARLNLPRCDANAYQVLIYFSHRIPDPDPGKAAPAERQADFATAVETFLEAGSGVVSFHHGSYAWPGKEAMIDIIGASASGAVPYDTVYGQDVVAVAPGHFVTSYALSYTGTTSYADPARGVPAASYPYLNNVPDERYPTFTVNPTAADFVVLFEAKYAANDAAPHLLGFTHRRPNWRGVVVGYQPGEYEPHSCAVANPNFQILANAIVYAADVLWPPPQPDGMTLRMVKTGVADEVELRWTGSKACDSYFRSLSPAAVTALANRLGKTPGGVAKDTPPAGDLHFYGVTGR